MCTLLQHELWDLLKWQGSANYILRPNPDYNLFLYSPTLGGYYIFKGLQKTQKEKYETKTIMVRKA